MNVLVVDDQYEVVQAVIGGVDWKKVGVDRVIPAYSVKEAKAVFGREEVHILLCDVEMPPTDGFELLRWAQERYPGVVSIFLSAYAEFEYAREAVRLGSFDYILQPAPYDEIERALETAVKKVRAARKIAESGRAVEVEEPQAGPEPDDRRPVDRVKDYIRENIDKDLSRTEIAEAVYLNPEYLSHLFKRETGKSLGDYIISEKMGAAQSLLKDTNIQVSAVAARVGYSNFSYFSQVFKKFSGLTPVEYRAQHQGLKNDNKT